MPGLVFSSLACAMADICRGMIFCPRTGHNHLVARQRRNPNGGNRRVSGVLGTDQDSPAPKAARSELATHQAAFFSRPRSRGTILPLINQEGCDVTRATASNNKRQRRSHEAWREVLTRFAASGLEVEAFCANEGVSVSSFRRWRSLLADEMSLGGDLPQPGEQTGFLDAATAPRSDSGAESADR